MDTVCRPFRQSSPALRFILPSRSLPRGGHCFRLASIGCLCGVWRIILRHRPLSVSKATSERVGRSTVFRLLQHSTKAICASLVIDVFTEIYFSRTPDQYEKFQLNSASFAAADQHRLDHHIVELIILQQHQPFQTPLRIASAARLHLRIRALGADRHLVQSDHR